MGTASTITSNSNQTSRTQTVQSQTPSSSTTQNSSQYSSPTPATRQLPPVSTPPRLQPPPPPRAASRPGASALGTPSSQPHQQGRRTPEPQPPPAFTKEPLPPAPSNTPQNWPANAYGLPARPSPGNLQGGTFAASSDKVAVPFPRSGSPLRGAAARVIHQKSGSMSQMARGSAPTSGVAQRPGTSGDTVSSPISHPYGPGGNNNNLALQVPAAGLAGGFVLSPITESPATANPVDPNTPSAQSGYSVGRGPFAKSTSQAPQGQPLIPLEELKRLCVKFILGDDGHSRVVNVGDCQGGVELIERVLRKMGKMTNGPLKAMETEDGGLVVDGYAVYLEAAGQDSRRKIFQFGLSLLLLTPSQLDSGSTNRSRASVCLSR